MGFIEDRLDYMKRNHPTNKMERRYLLICLAHFLNLQGYSDMHKAYIDSHYEFPLIRWLQKTNHHRANELITIAQWIADQWIHLNQN